MPKYQVLVEEIYSGYVEIEADTPADAEQIATEMTSSGEINPVDRFDSNTYVEVIDDMEGI
jgi:hypothetical protein